MDLPASRRQKDAPAVDGEGRVESVDHPASETTGWSRIVTQGHQVDLSQSNPFLDRLLALEGDPVDESGIAFTGVPLEPGPDFGERPAGIGSDAVRLRLNSIVFIMPDASGAGGRPARCAILANDLRERASGLHHQ